MTLKELYKNVESLMASYGEDCPVKSFSQLKNVSPTPSIWYDEDEDAILID